MRKRILAILLAAVMLLGTLPVGVTATEPSEDLQEAPAANEGLTPAQEADEEAPATTEALATETPTTEAPTTETPTTEAPTTETSTTEAPTGETAEAPGQTDWSSLTAFTEGDTYYIATAADLAAFRDLVNGGNTGSGCTFALTADIDLSTECSEELGTWVPIGNTTKIVFSGVFDGCGHTITNLYIAAAKLKSGGLFWYVKNATLCNLTLSGDVSNTKNNIAAFVMQAENTTISNCINYTNVNAKASAAFAYIAKNSTITDCVNYGDLTSGAGIVYQLSGDEGTIQNCVNNGNFGSGAGIVYTLSSSTQCTVRNCVNNGNIGTETGGASCGIVANGSSATIEDCRNTGNITSTYSAYGIGSIETALNCVNTGKIVGGTAAGIGNGSCENCRNTGKIEGANTAAGITSSAYGVTLINCVNTGDVSATQPGGACAGILAKANSTALSTVADCRNFGNVSGVYFVGGLVGDIEASTTIENCYNRGNISGFALGAVKEGKVGGLVGCISLCGDTSVEIKGCYNSGSIHVPELSEVGGLVGSISNRTNFGDRSVTIRHTYNAGTVTGDSYVGGLFGSVNHDDTYGALVLRVENCYSAAGQVTAMGENSGSAIGCIADAVGAEQLAFSNVFVQGISKKAAIGSGRDKLDTNAVMQLTYAQMADHGFVTLLGSAFAKFSTDIYNGQAYDEEAWATYSEYYGDYAYPILVALCDAAPLSETCNVQFLGAQYATVTVNGTETYATTVTLGSEIRFTVETGTEDITVTSVAVGETVPEATDGVYTYTVSADTVVTVTLSGSMANPNPEDEPSPVQTWYPVAFAVTDGSASLADVQIAVTDAEGNEITPNEGVYRLEPGTYTVAAAKDGYRSVTGTFTVTNTMQKEETNTVSFRLFAADAAERSFTMKIVAWSTLDTVSVCNGDVTVETQTSAENLTFALPAGSYRYSATKAGSGYGSGPFTVADTDDEQTLTLRAMDITTYGLSNTSGVGYTISMVAADGTEYLPGSTDAKNGGGARGWFLLPASEYGEAYTYRVTPVSDYYWGSYGVTYLYSGYAGVIALRDFNGISGSQSDTGKFLIAPKTTATFTVPTGASFEICHRVKFYEPLEIITPSSTVVNGEMTTYTYDIPSGNTLHYQLKLDGYVKKAATFTGKQNLTITTADLTPASVGAQDIAADIDSAILTNAPSSHYIEMDVGEHFELYLHRNWQASNSITGNYYVDPDYHVEVIYGDSVTVTDPYYAGANLNAVSEGISVVRVTYDALDFVNTSGTSYIYSKLYEENTTLLIIDVGGNGAEVIDDGCGASEYEIQYFIRSINGLTREDAEQYATLTFTPSENVTSVEVHDPVGSGDVWTDEWTAAQKNEDGTFTAHLRQGSNVLRYTTADGVTTYRVLRAIGLDITATGETLHVSLNDGRFLLEAELNHELTISFDGLQMPLPKLAALINPGLQSVPGPYGWGLEESTYVQYTLSGLNAEAQTVNGKKSQYNISTKNALTLTFDQADTYTLSEGALHTTSFGAGSYTGMTRGGYTGTQPTFPNSSNTVLDTRSNLYSAMPELTILICAHETFETTTVEPTCTDGGFDEHQCTVCSYHYRDNFVDALGHDYAEQTVGATCTSDGYTVHTCRVCGSEYRDTFTPAVDHDYEDDVVKATCTTGGYTISKCKDCGYSYVSGQTEALGHSYADTVTEPTHSTMGYTAHTCSVCGHTYTDAYTQAIEHTFVGKVTKEATCTEPGEMTFTCSCGESYTEVIPVTAHTYIPTVTRPTCTAMGYTTYTCACGESYLGDFTDALPHETEDTVVEATCVCFGYTVSACKHCDYSTVTAITAPTGHTPSVVNAEDASWHGEGYTGDTVCAVCDTVLAKGEAIAALGCPSEGFADVQTDAWYHEAVDYAVGNGLMNGTAAVTFEPESTTTRAMLAVLLYRIAGEPDVDGWENPFADVAGDAWYYEAVVWAYHEGVINGMTATSFDPDGKITREQLAVMLWRYAGKPEADKSVLNGFVDAETIGKYATDAVAWAVENDFINGMGNEKLEPTGSATRAQIATILMRYLEQ